MGDVTRRGMIGFLATFATGTLPATVSTAQVRPSDGIIAQLSARAGMAMSEVEAALSSNDDEAFPRAFADLTRCAGAMLLFEPRSEEDREFMRMLATARFHAALYEISLSAELADALLTKAAKS